MGYSAQVQQSPGQYSSGKGSPMDGGNSGQAGTGYNPMAGGPREYNSMAGGPNQPMGKGGAVTNSATSGQPRMGQPNMYPNTVGQAGGLGQPAQMGGSKGKAGGMASAPQQTQPPTPQGKAAGAGVAPSTDLANQQQAQKALGVQDQNFAQNQIQGYPTIGQPMVGQLPRVNSQY